MEEEIEPTEHEEQGLLLAYIDRLVGSIGWSFAFFISISVVTFPTVFGIVQAGPDETGFLLLSLIGTSLYLSQMQIKGVIDGSYEDVSKFTEGLMDIVGVLYYNIILMIAVLFGLAFATVGYPMIGVLVAILLPITDIEMSRRVWFLSASGILGNITLRIGQVITQAYIRFSTRKFAQSVADLLELLHTIVPSPFQRMSISSGNRRRLS
jgi:hypothetical protein